MSRPKVAIIVLIYNGLEYLEDCFSSLEKLDYPKEDLEIIAVDNCSTESTVEFMKKNFPEVTLIESKKNLGYCGGNNLAIKYGLKKDFDYFFILNPDIIIGPECLKRLVSVIEQDKEIGIVQPKILLWQDKTRIQTSGNKIHYLGFAYSGDYRKEDNLSKEKKEITYASGSGMLVRRKIFEKTGLLPEYYFMYHDDLELGWQTWLYGYKIFLVPTAVLYHNYSFSRNKRKYFWMERNRCWFILKNYKIGTLILFAPALVITELGLLAYSLTSGWFGWKIKSYIAIFSKLNKVFKDRKRIQKQRIRSDREMSKLLTSMIKFEEVDNPILKMANIFFSFYWQIIKLLIFQ